MSHIKKLPNRCSFNVLDFSLIVLRVVYKCVIFNVLLTVDVDQVFRTTR
jgi:hypothetical protein